MATFDLNDDALIRQLAVDIESSDFKTRREDEYKAYEVFAGNVGGHVERRLMDLFPQSYTSMRKSAISFSHKIVSTLAKSYKEPPLRKLENENDSKLLNELYAESNINFTFAHFDSLYNLHRHAMLWISRDDLTGQLIPRALRPDQFSVVRDKFTGKVDVFILNFPTSEITNIASDLGDGIDQLVAEDQADANAQTKVYGLWTDNQHRVVKIRVQQFPGGKAPQIEITDIEIPGNEERVNDLGMIPAAYLSKDPSFELPLLNPITEQTLEMNTLLSDVLTASSQQGFGQLVLRYPAGTKFEKVHTGITTAIELPQATDPDAPETDAKYINASPDLAGQLDVIRNYWKMVAEEHGVQAGNLTGTNAQEFTSALDRAISNAPTTDVMEINQAMYRKLEQNVFEIVKAYAKSANQNVFSKDEMLQVIYKKPKVLISDKETLDNIDKRLSLGLIEEWEKFKIIDPNLTETEARAKLERVNAERAKSVQSLIPAGFGSTDNTDAASGSDNKNLPQ